MGKIKLHITDKKIRLHIAEARTVYIGDGEPYSGEYFVVPKVDEQTILQTAEKVMTKNVTVEKIPLYEAANSAGGNTLSIGEMYYG